jgi:hypothetical protein
MFKKTVRSVVAGCVLGLGANVAMGADVDMQEQIDQAKGVLPKFAIPIREVGDRFQNMRFAAKGGNWALAAYMSKYMNGSMSPASVTKPEEYKVWQGFYSGAFAPVDKAIQAKDLKAFESAYKGVIEGCNGCHSSMG